jgi:16S rRNA processing protein RimM
VVRPDSAQQPPERLIVAGKVTTVHGVKGWLKVHSYTTPEANIFDYQPWWMRFPEGWRKLEIDQFRAVTLGFIAHVKGLDDRDEARCYCQREIQVSPAAFPPADDGEFYWHQLENLHVLSNFEGSEHLLGIVSGLMETGANDVLMVEPCEGSLDRQSRLIPYIDQVIVSVSPDEGLIRVNWDPDFDKPDRKDQ